MEHITVENYKDMRRRMEDSEIKDFISGSSNFGKFMELFENSDSGWIEKINENIE